MVDLRFCGSISVSSTEELYLEGLATHMLRHPGK